jgi:hypothetical protein
MQQNQGIGGVGWGGGVFVEMPWGGRVQEAAKLVAK